MSLVYDGVKLRTLQMTRLGEVEKGIFIRGVYLNHGRGEVGVRGFDVVGLVAAV